MRKFLRMWRLKLTLSALRRSREKVVARHDKAAAELELAWFDMRKHDSAIGALRHELNQLDWDTKYPVDGVHGI